jgi:iron complex transport system permease protein
MDDTPTNEINEIQNSPWPRSLSWRWFPLAFLCVGIIAVLCLALGSVPISPLTTIKVLLAQIPQLQIEQTWPKSYNSILIDIRLPRVLLIGFTGMALACAGTAYQGVFRNPLADPYLIGVASGASFGAICVIILRTKYPEQIGSLTIPVGSFTGALLIVALVYSLGRVGNSTPTTTLLLAGVALGTLASALTTFVVMRAGQQMGLYAAFLAGAYSTTGWQPLQLVAPLVLLGFGIMYWFARPLNLLLFDEEQAQLLGVNVERVKIIVILVATLMTALVVAFSGPIGFVGLIIPHSMRMLVGSDHRHLLPYATLGGAGFLMLADLLARTVIAPEELPLGVVTALAGVPFFLFLLRRAKHAAFF